MLDKIYDFITVNGLIPAGATVYAAVSGGADSVCLLSVLYKLRDRLHITLRCAHFNHGLRGAESDGDEAFVKELCEKLGVPFIRAGADVRALANRGDSLEDAARRARYAFFDALPDGALIATAHTLGDNVETFFINLLRGSGSRGLSGIPVKRGRMIRPMLKISRGEILAYLEAEGLSYRTDSTNADTAYLRNFIRLELLPRLSERADADPYRTVERAMENLKAEDEALTALAPDTDDCAALAALPEAVLWRSLDGKLEKEYGVHLDNTHFFAVKSLLCESGRRQIKGDLFAVCERGRLRFERLVPKDGSEIPLSDGETAAFGKRIVIKKATEINKRLTKDRVDCDKIYGELKATLRRDGDVFFSKRASARLKKQLKSDGVPPSERDKLIVIRDGRGDTVLVERYGADARFAADENSKNIAVIEITADTGGK